MICSLWAMFFEHIHLIGKGDPEYSYQKKGTGNREQGIGNRIIKN
jgi:hypothetical protein